MKLYLESSDRKTAIPYEETDTFCTVFAHGRLFEENGYDIIDYRIGEKPDERRCGIEDVTVVLPDGREVESVLYHWRSKETRMHKGLVIAKDDCPEVFAYAQRKLDERSSRL